MMKAVQYAEFGEPLEVAKVVDVERPVPKPNEVIIQIEASPLRYADMYLFKGDH
jgi:NADPH:quinone reductase-like Zn-dependent oxidoreductase